MSAMMMKSYDDNVCCEGGDDDRNDDSDDSSDDDRNDDRNGDEVWY